MWPVKFPSFCKVCLVRCAMLQSINDNLLRRSNSLFHISAGIGTCSERLQARIDYSAVTAVSDNIDKRDGKMTLAENLARLVEEPSKPDERRPNNHVECKRSSTARVQACSYCSPVTAACDDIGKHYGKMTLAENLASLVEESSKPDDRRPKSRMELKRSFELRIKKRVKEHYMNGKFENLMMNVVANPQTLQDAYNCILLNSNVDISSANDNLSFTSLAEELSSGSFDISANTFTVSTKGVNKETLVLPKLKLRVIQEAIRIVLEVVYKPQFSKISHGCRSGRGHHTALKYISKQISNPDWWFTLTISQNLDAVVLDKLISVMEDRIEDPCLYNLIRGMSDAHAINMVFGDFPKGHGLPQEGVLSPILMNIYLDVFDREFLRLSMRYEALDPGMRSGGVQSHSKLRSWFRKQLRGSDAEKCDEENSGPGIHCCRFMDELFFAVSGSQDIALDFKSEIANYLQNSLHLDVGSQTDILPCAGPQAIRFLGILVKRTLKEGPAVKAVHKLKDKVNLFLSHKQEAWDVGTLRIGKKWLGHGLKKVKESEIKHLANNSSLLSQISSFRKDGMKTDHWYKHLLKIWMHDADVRLAESEDEILTKCVVEPALPKDLRNSFYEFQKLAEEYVCSETATTNALLPNSNTYTERITKIIAPINTIKKRLLRYGMITSKGNTCMSRLLILQDDIEIIYWFSGIVNRWRRWYADCDNFDDIKLIIRDHIRQSCIRTLAAKYRIHESKIEKKFDYELSRIPYSLETEQKIENETTSISLAFDNDEALMYGISNSGLCLLSLARMVSQSRPCHCFVMGCSAVAPSVYTLHVMERQKFPVWKTGFPSSIHPSLNRRRIGLCKQHLKDIYAGNISLQSIDFSSWK